MSRRARVIGAALIGAVVVAAAVLVGCGWKLQPREGAGELAANEEGRPLAVAFTLPNDDGSMVSLDELLVRGPAVLVFYRGHW